MRFFLKACDLVRIEGLHGVLESNKEQPNTYMSGNKVNYDVYDKFLDILKDCKPIVFLKNLHFKNDFSIEKRITDESVGYGSFSYHESTRLDAPFKSFCIENFEDAPLYSGIGTTDKTQFHTKCIFVHEMSPKKYIFFNLNYFEVHDYWVLEPNNSVRTAHAVEQHLTALNSWRVGFESTRQSIKVGIGKNSEHRRIRKIVYVCPKKEYEKQNEKLGKQIDWSHRWLVRGHWRKCEGALGKDREGLHCVPNYTWVVDYVKGPEDKVLIADKTRIVKKQNHNIKEIIING